MPVGTGSFLVRGNIVTDVGLFEGEETERDRNGGGAIWAAGVERLRYEGNLVDGATDVGLDMDIFPFMMHRDAGLPKVIDYLNLWAREAPMYADFLLVRYEDMRADTAGTLERQSWRCH